jgi:hypothetical protein
MLLASIFTPLRVTSFTILILVDNDPENVTLSLSFNFLLLNNWQDTTHDWICHAPSTWLLQYINSPSSCGNFSDSLVRRVV